MAFDNESGVISALAHNTAEITQQPIDSDSANQNIRNTYHILTIILIQLLMIVFNEVCEKFTFEHIHSHTGEAFVPNVPVHVKSIVVERTDECSAAFLDPHLFCITAQHGCYEWTTYKRYRHFQDLHRALMNFVNIERKKSQNDLDISQDENNEYPCIPTRNDLTAFTNDSIVEELC
ncbi:unnamed protein product, partial [Rotaria sp. Silwood1]